MIVPMKVCIKLLAVREMINVLVIFTKLFLSWLFDNVRFVDYYERRKGVEI